MTKFTALLEIYKIFCLLILLLKNEKPFEFSFLLSDLNFQFLYPLKHHSDATAVAYLKKLIFFTVFFAKWISTGKFQIFNIWMRKLSLKFLERKIGFLTFNSWQKERSNKKFQSSLIGNSFGHGWVPTGDLYTDKTENKTRQWRKGSVFSQVRRLQYTSRTYMSPGIAEGDIASFRALFYRIYFYPSKCCTIFIWNYRFSVLLPSQ